jgi:hypothetical protein
MDAFVHWHKRFEDPLREFPDEESYAAAREESLTRR